MRMCAKDPHCDAPVCLHKQLYPMLPPDVTVFFVIFMVSFLAGAPGIGGGGINVPLLMMLNRFTIKEAVPISHIAVMGNALSQLLFNTRLRHPSMPLRPLIHYEMAAILLPAMLGGNSLGIVVSKVFPPTALVLLSLLLLVLAGCKTMHKGVVAFRHGHRVKNGLGRSANALTNLQRPVLDARDTLSTASDSVLHGVSVRDRGQQSLQSTSADSMQSLDDSLPMRIPWKAIWFMIGFNLIFCLDYLAMAQDVFGVERCSTVYWIALLGLYPVVAVSVLMAMRFMQELAAWHESRHDPPVEGEPDLGRAGLTLVPLLAMAVGLLAGLLGLGGGEFMVPLLLELGLAARVAAATSGFLIFFNTSSNAIHYLIGDTIQPFLDYGIPCFIFAMLGSLCGLLAGNTHYVRTHSYIIIFLVAFALFASAILLMLRGFAEVDWAFGGFC